MGIYISGVKGLPEQVQQNKEDIKTIQEEIEGIDFEEIRQLETQVGENTQDINNLEAAIGVQNQAINGLKDDVDALESKTQKITYNEQSGELTIDSNVNIKRINITASQTPLRADSMVSQDDKNAISLTGANDEISLIVGRSGTQHILNFNADGTLDIDGQPVGGTTLYLHTLYFIRQYSADSYNFIVTIINDDPTPIDKPKLINYLITNGYTSNDTRLPATGTHFNTTKFQVCGIIYSTTAGALYVSTANMEASGYYEIVSNTSLPGQVNITDKVIQIA